ncbi:MAG TPA: multidrug efflux RND transporter permease subunit [Patescibacteria group bacterium]|nr:multidrug efflux RND transporter permease subunit [Patescibacteria group bacterium]
MARFFIERPVFAIVLSIVITLCGLIAGLNLPIAQYPQIAPPQVSVSASYQGANADVVEETVAQIVEQQVNGVENMVSMQSTSSDAGTYSLSVQFEPEKNADFATVQTQNRVAQSTPALPQDVQQAGVTTTKASQDLALIFALYSDNDRYENNFLKNYGSIYLLEEIKRVKGVGSVMEFGSDYGMRVWLQPDKMAQLGITTQEVSAAITEQNAQAPAGAIGKRPNLPDQEFQYSTRAKGRLDQAEEFANIIVRTDAKGSFVRVKDIARTEFGSKDYSFFSEVNRHPTTGFAVQLSSDANALETVSNVRKVLENAALKFPPDMKYKIIVDTTLFVRESMTEVVITFIEALALVLLVVFLFLQSWRATLIPMLAIPVSLIGTFGAFYVLGFSINTLTLFAMVLAIGLVVDDAIVVIEAVEHHMRYSGMKPKEATIRAMDEVSGPVVAIAFVLASVFLPVAFFGGTMGILYKQFALTVAVSMALSALVALSLTPALCATLLKPHQPNAHPGLLGRFFEAFNNWFDRTLDRYTGRVGKFMRRTRLCAVFLVILVILIGGLYRLVPTGFVPSEDQGYMISALTLPEASSMNRSMNTVRQVGDTIRQQPGIEDTMTVAGYDLLGGGNRSNAAVIFTRLAPWDERTTPNLQLGAEIGQVYRASAHIPEANIITFPPPSLPGLGMVGGFTMMLQDRNGVSTQELEDAANKFLAAARKRPEIGMIYSNFKPNTPGYEFQVDRDKIKSLGISVSDVFTTLQACLGGVQVNDFSRFGHTYKVIVQAEPEFRNDIDNIRFFFLKSSSGTLVPLDTLIKPVPISTSTMNKRYNGFRAAQINGNPATGYSSGQAIAALEQVAAETLPSGFGYEWSGQSREEKVSSSKTPLLFTLAFIFVFLCLAALYESWSVPFAVLFSIPTGVFGAFLAQYARNLENNVYMQIGIVMLIGLAAKNAILIVEFAKVRTDKGMDAVGAAIEAARLRLRPILMTSLAFIIGCIPLAMATGAGAGARNAMGTAVVGGMMMATAMGIFLIPVFFVVVERIVFRIRNLKNKGIA